MFLYEILENIMNEKSLKVSDIAKLTNLTDSTIRSIITRKSKTVSLEVAFKLSKGLNVSLERLNGEDVSQETTYNKFTKSEKKTLSSEDETILSLYNQLDEGDKGEIRGEIKHMLKAKKYSSQNVNMDMEIAEEIAPQIPIDINKMSVDELEEEYKKRKLKSALKRTTSNVLNTTADTKNTNTGDNASNQWKRP